MFEIKTLCSAFAKLFLVVHGVNIILHLFNSLSFFNPLSSPQAKVDGICSVGLTILHSLLLFLFLCLHYGVEEASGDRGLLMAFLIGSTTTVLGSLLAFLLYAGELSHLPLIVWGVHIILHGVVIGLAWTFYRGTTKNSRGEDQEDEVPNTLTGPVPSLLSTLIGISARVRAEIKRFWETRQTQASPIPATPESRYEYDI